MSVKIKAKHPLTKLAQKSKGKSGAEYTFKEKKGKRAPLKSTRPKTPFTAPVEPTERIPGVAERTRYADPSTALSNHWKKHPVLRTLTELPRLISEFDSLRSRESEVKAMRETARGSILTTLQLAQIPASTDDNKPLSRVACMGFEVFYTESKEGRVSMEKFKHGLILLGVGADVIEEAEGRARSTTTSQTLQVKAIKVEEGEGAGK